MTADCFLDANVLVYAAAGRGPEDAKRRLANELLTTKDFGLSAQVLQEFYVTVTRKIAEPLSVRKAMEWLAQFDAFPCVPIDAAIVKIAVELSERYRISYWDGAIIAAAQALGASTLYTEDLQHGQDYAGVRAVNPFRTPI